MAENKKTPKVRFAGFTDSWKRCKLSDFAEIVGGGTPDTNNPAYWDGDIDWYAPAEMEDQRYAINSVRKITELGLHKSSAKVLPALRTVLFTSRAGIGKMAILRHPAATNQGFQSLVLKDETDPYFIYSMGDIIKNMAEGVASGSTFLEISGRMLGTLEVVVPTFKEQKEIALFFRSIDDLIEFHKHKYDHLKKIKKSMLEKMFPRNGSNVPEIRFAGFTGAWERHDLSELADYLSSNLTVKDTIADGLYDLYDANSLIGRTNHKPIDVDYITVIKDGAGVGRIRKLPKNSMFIGTMGALIAKGSDIDFIHSMLTRFNLGKAYSGSTIPHIYFKDYGKNEYYVPNIDEQQTIGLYFKHLGNLITLHKQKYEKLKQIKKSLLEKMFV